MSTLLSLTAGITPGGRHSVPAAGGLYTTECYVTVRRANGIPAGIYHYQPVENTLEQLLEGTEACDQVAKCLYEEFARDANVLIIITALPARAVQKYGQRGLRYSLLEAGSVLQNGYLATTAMGLSACAIGGVDESALVGILDLDEVDEFPVIILAIGSPS